MPADREVQTTSSQPFSLYTPVHKGLRSRLYRISTRAGKISYMDEAVIGSFSAEFAPLAASIRLHHDLEEKFIHPLVADRVPGGTIKLAEEHRIVEQMLTDLLSHLQGIRNKPAKFEKHRELGLEFYLAYNRFIAFFLNHINWEEEQTQRSLWNLCTGDELMSTFGRILSAQSPEQTMDNLTMILPSVTLDELTGIFMGAKASVPAEGFQKMLKLGEGIVDAADWSALKTRIGLAS